MGSGNTATNFNRVFNPLGIGAGGPPGVWGLNPQILGGPGGRTNPNDPQSPQAQEQAEADKVAQQEAEAERQRQAQARQLRMDTAQQFGADFNRDVSRANLEQALQDAAATSRSVRGRTMSY